MNKATIAEINRLKQKIPTQDNFRHALFTICRGENGFVIEEIVSNDFAHLPEAIMGDERYLIGSYPYEFDTIQEAIAFVDKKRHDYTGIMPCLALFGGFTRAEMEQIKTIKKMIFLNTKYLAFLYGIETKDEYRTKIIDD